MRLFRTPRFFRRIFPRMTWGFSRNTNAIYLTFDDGPDPLVTPWVLEELRKYNAKATFFCVGCQVQRFPELFDQIKKEGHSVGNHTMNHENGFKTKDSNYLKSIREADESIDSNLFRPPYGRISFKQMRKVSNEGYKIIMWSWLTYDFDERVKTARILRSAEQLKSGDIVVLHDNPKCFSRLKLLLPEILSQIQKKELNPKAIEV